jgi:hypothetical protein
MGHTSFRIAWWSIVVCSCTAVNGMLSHPATNASPGSTAAGAAPPVAFTSKDDHWHRVADDFVANDASDQEPVKARHERIAKFCGHDIKFVFDWSTFKSNEWIGTNMGAGYTSDELTAAKNCSGELLPELARACESDGGHRAGLAKVQTVTCISKPEAELYANHGYNHTYKVSPGGTNIESWICPRLMDGVDQPVDKFIEKNF